MGASELAAGHRRRDPALSAGWLKYLIYSDSVVSFTGGTLLGLGGPAAAPITAPPALAMYFTIRLRLCLAIAVLGGKGVLDPWAGAATLACFFGTDAGELLAARPALEDLDAAAAAAARGGAATGGWGGGGGASPAGVEGAAPGDGTGGSAGDGDREAPGACDAPPASRENIAVRAVKNARDSVTGAMARVFEAGAAAQSAAQRAAAEAAARAALHVRSRGGSDEDAAAASERAYVLSLPGHMVRAMGESVFTAANMVVVAAELVPIVSSVLTVRAANAAIRCHLPHLAPAAASELEAAKDSAAAREAAEVPPLGRFGERLNESARAAGEAAREGWERTRGATVAATGATVTAVTDAGAAIGDATSAAVSSAGASLAAAGSDAGASISNWWSRARAAVVGASSPSTSSSLFTSTQSI